jgi:hypothetical protein
MGTRPTGVIGTNLTSNGLRNKSMIEGIKIFGYVKKSKKIYMVVGTNL